MLNRIKLRWLISSAGFYSLIVPLSYRWFKKPQFQWFAPAALREPERTVINALAGFPDAMCTFLRSRRKLAPFSKPLSVLEDFFFELAERTEVLDESPDNPASQKQGDEKALLGRFAREVRPLLLEAHRLNALGRMPLVRFVWFRQIIGSHSVRYAAALSGITAVVMAIGTVLFKISPSQAFLTWFTVAFGSLTISVGVTAFSLHEERKKERRPPDAGAAS
jgi:hypothetical protein